MSKIVLSDVCIAKRIQTIYCNIYTSNLLQDTHNNLLKHLHKQPIARHTQQSIETSTQATY